VQIVQKSEKRNCECKFRILLLTYYTADIDLEVEVVYRGLCFFIS